MPKCLCFIVKFDMVQLPRLKQSLLPIKSSNIKNITGGYLYFGCFNSLGSLNPYLLLTQKFKVENFELIIIKTGMDRFQDFCKV